MGEGLAGLVALCGQEPTEAVRALLPEAGPQALMAQKE